MDLQLRSNMAKKQQEAAEDNKVNLAPTALKTKMSVKEINLARKESAKEELRDEGFEIPETPENGLKTIKQRNLALKQAAKDAIKKEA